MSDTNSPAATPPANPPATKAAGKPLPTPAPTPTLTPDARGIEQAQFTRILARDDAMRAKAEKVTLLAISSFTVVEDDEDGNSSERVVNAGEEFEISQHDLPRYGGRGRPVVLDAPNKAGVTIGRE